MRSIFHRKLVKSTLIQFIGLLSLVLLAFTSLAQDIPIGSWRTHLSYRSVSTLALTPGEIYAASATGFFSFDRNTSSSTILSRSDGFSDTEVSQVAYNETTQTLLVAYRNGNIDLLQNNTITNIDDIATSADIANKQINHIYFAGNLAYLSANFGVVVLDIQRQEIRETYRNIGANGSNLAVNASTITSNTLFLATARGILAAPVTGVNLLDFSNWRRYGLAEGIPSVLSNSIASRGEQVYASLVNEGVYFFENGNWQKVNMPSITQVNSIQASNNTILISAQGKIVSIAENNLIQEIVHPLILNPQKAIYDETGKLWIADATNGLISNYAGEFQSFIPNGPASSSTWSLASYNKSIVALSGGFTSGSFLPLNQTSGFSVFTSTGWVNYTSTSNEPAYRIPPVKDLVSAAYNSTDNKLYIGSFGEGLLVANADGTFETINASNSPLQPNTDGSLAITGLAVDAAGNTWITSFGAAADQPSLYVKKTDNTWQSYIFNNTAARRPLSVLVDDSNYKWIRLAPPGGGIWVFDEKETRSRYLSTVLGQGGLPSNTVNALVKDKEGQVWVGTDRGVALYFNPFSVFNSMAFDALTPIFERRPLLSNEVVSAIAIDGGNRKWIGTRNGVWLFNADATELIHHFTTQNSPLLSDNILDIAIQPATGEVFIATDKGLISYRGSATEGEATHTHVKVFPNPVRPDFTGLVGISGLVNNALVKITDISGRLVYQTRAQGSTAVWNVQDYTGRRAATGIYLIYSSDAEGNETLVTKMAVIE
ncbi:two-component regulator propeller domain-containing protein [Rhodocytophaga aerolata]|uniref:Two-component regulator propeller domain-containing protein n=1 Tax=Rhodocytophaga aerolata TaxID=455078 RepID=A0ABT8RD68_9BACT|nr:two-component regulator propeller domain-containing protein [Rhodocytophaga aerolata]MDO1450048.1 two-component regulator propeller domain-containing protein [Rhodocytophaga aerolata]